MIPALSSSFPFIDFVRADRPAEFKPGKHIDILCEALQAVAEREIKRLMVFMPPRHSKSEVVSRKFPAWYLGCYPDRNIILTSYAAELAEDFSRAARNTLVNRVAWFGGVGVAIDSKAVGRWNIGDHRGGMVAAGVGGPITGRGADVALIDDPTKNWEEAQSEIVREGQKQWYKSTLRTRLAPEGAIVLVQTRWHEDDLAGWLIEESKRGGEKWEIINFPAIAEEGDQMGRLPGEPLWPAMFDLAELSAIKDSLGSYLWSAMYQQSPRPIEGARFKQSWFRYFRVNGEFYELTRSDGSVHNVPVNACWRFQTIDPAATEKETSDWFVVSTWAVTPERDLLLLDVFRERAETTKHEEICTTLFRRFSPDFVGVEKQTYGLNIIQRLLMLGLPVIELKADRDKLSRSLTIQTRYQAGTVYHLQDAPWLDVIEAELLGFPTAKFDDFVDTASYAGATLLAYAPWEEPEKHEMPPDDRTDSGLKARLAYLNPVETDDYY